MLPPISLQFASAGHDAEYSSAFLRDGTAWCARGYEALMLVFRQAGFTSCDRILLPAFHCPSITEAIHRAGLQAEYHQVNADLTPVASDVAERLSLALELPTEDGGDARREGRLFDQRLDIPHHAAQIALGEAGRD